MKTKNSVRPPKAGAEYFDALQDALVTDIRENGAIVLWVGPESYEVGKGRLRGINLDYVNLADCFTDGEHRIYNAIFGVEHPKLPLPASPDKQKEVSK
jgi:hypothetical protein